MYGVPIGVYFRNEEVREGENDGFMELANMFSILCPWKISRLCAFAVYLGILV